MMATLPLVGGEDAVGHGVGGDEPRGVAERNNGGEQGEQKAKHGRGSWG